MTRIWLVNWHFQSRITLWCRHKSTNVSMGLWWQMPKFIVWRLWSIYFDHHLPLKPSIGKRRKQSCIPNIYIYIYIEHWRAKCSVNFFNISVFNATSTYPWFRIASYLCGKDSVRSFKDLRVSRFLSNLWRCDRTQITINYRRNLQVGFIRKTASNWFTELQFAQQSVFKGINLHI